jgi:hypothetical protein
MFLSGKKLLNCGEQKKSESIIRQPTKSPFNLAFGSKGHGETIKSIDEVLSSADSRHAGPQGQGSISGLQSRDSMRTISCAWDRRKHPRRTVKEGKDQKVELGCWTGNDSAIFTAAPPGRALPHPLAQGFKHR